MSNQDDRHPSEMVPFVASQIVVGALIAGVLFFTLIAVAITQGKAPQTNLIVYVAVAMAAGAIVLSAIIPSIIVKQKLAEYSAQGVIPSVTEFFALYQTRNIIRCALLEGAAFVSPIAYIITAVPWVLGAALLLVAAMAVDFPTRDKFNNWVREQRELASFDQNSKTD